jgi:hypothetical protein
VEVEMEVEGLPLSTNSVLWAVWAA